MTRRSTSTNAGHKATLDLEPIYERHAALADLETARTLGAAVDGDRGVRELWRFTCEAYLGDLVREHEERTARLEAELEVVVDGTEVPYRMVRPTMATSPIATAAAASTRRASR